jgi:L-fuculose-phosphate aldolase
MELSTAREKICAMGRTLLAEGLVAGTWGNISVRLDAERMAITPTGEDYTALAPDDVPVVVIADGSFTGKKPSSEWKLHAAIYQSRSDVNAVIHTHSMSASTVASARRDVPPILDDLAQIIGPGVRCAPYALPSTKKIVRVTMRALAGRNAALLANHGAVCVGRDLPEALTCCQILEKGCRAFIEAEFLGGAKPLSHVEAALMHQFYLRKYARRGKESRDDHERQDLPV